VVVAIIGGLVALLLPAVQAARESARRTQCQNNLRQLAVAMEQHVERHREYPIGCIGCPVFPLPAGEVPVTPRFFSWNAQLLPFLERTELWDSLDWTVASYQTVNKRVGATVISAFLCPSTEADELHSPANAWNGTAFTDYGGIYGVEGVGHDAPSGSKQNLRDESLGVMLFNDPIEPEQITDGLSRTASIAELSFRRLPTETEWINGRNVFAQEAATPINGPAAFVNEIGSPHPHGALLAFCDGHVVFVPESIDQTALNAMLTKAGGEQ